jgi:hypothetical protein
MRRFKDTSINREATASGLPPRLQKILNNLAPLDPNKFKSKGKDPLTNAPILDRKAPSLLKSAIDTVKGKSGIDEQIVRTTSIVGGVGGVAWSGLQAILSQSREWAYLIPAIGMVAGLSAWYAKAKPGLRQWLIELYPHHVDTLKKIETKNYSVLEQEIKPGARPDFNEYTLPEILEHWNKPGGMPAGGQWKNNGKLIKFADQSEVDRLNQLFRHQYWSNFRDTMMSIGAIPASAFAVGMGYNAVLKMLDEKFDENPNRAKANEILRETTVQPQQEREQTLEGHTKIPGREGYFKYDKNNSEERSDGTYYYVPRLKNYYKVRL